jgi:hypothetical protein
MCYNIVTTKGKPREGRKRYIMITNETITARFAADRHATIAWKQQLSADLDVIVAAYGAADKPADTIAAAAAEIGIDRVRAIIATLTVYRVAMYDRRISDDTAAWAQTIADALDADAAQRVGLISDAIHPAHLDQLARAAAEYVEPETVETTTETHETAPAAEPETETAERAAEINPMCTDCIRCGSDCDGTTCETWTGCIYRETAAQRDIRLFDFYKRRLLALAGGEPLRWVCVQYLCSFPGLSPYDMGAELMAEGVKIIYDDTAITRAENAAERRRVQRAYAAREGARA